MGSLFLRHPVQDRTEQVEGGQASKDRDAAKEVTIVCRQLVDARRDDRFDRIRQ